MTNLQFAAGASCVLENTLIEHFDTGISCASDGEVVLKNSHIDGCGVGLDLNSDSKIQNSMTQIRNASKYGTVFTSNIRNFIASGAKKTIVSDLIALGKFATLVQCYCHGNIYLYQNNNNSLFSHDNGTGWPMNRSNSPVK